VHDFATYEAQYYIHCYDDFRKIPVHADQTPVIDDQAMQKLVNEMHANQQLRTWTSIELHDKYVSYGGQLTRKQLFTKLITYLGDDVVVLQIEGCAPIVGFRSFVGTILKVAKVDTVDEEKEDALVRMIKTEARGIPFNNKTYQLGDFTHTKTKQHTSSTLLRFVSKLISNGGAQKHR
jgi:hypothetical protein